ncbi:MAG: HAMP domain-containing histidine kinase [Bacteroidaceae bacterium]|nr:HAMP domain-containing histidine kinase [Bacteroidaceae bacterium]MBR1755497.1 HAMP domain-containing histidine kinase [Bacteroidaceae bacterium]
MQWTDRMRQVKILLSCAAVIICALSLIWSHVLVSDLALEEQRKVEVWAEAMRSLEQADEQTDLALVLKVINGNHTIPVVVLDTDGNVQTYRNLEVHAKSADDVEGEVLKKAMAMREQGNVVRISLSGNEFMEVCYDESIMLRRLAQYPYIQLGIALIFVIVAVFALLSSKRAEQNKVWVGLSKETAHQLGTPISSLMAWTQVLRETYPDDELLPEMDKDVKRLQMIAERFSKIGSRPEPQPENLNEVISHVADYIGRRTNSRVHITTRLPQQPIYANLSASLFEWVVENLCKNAVDAMDGQGDITITALEEANRYVIEVADTGKGIPKSQFSSVFQPGFTTKTRGWGLGLSLAKRIVEEYHRGRIFVKSSEIGKGTTFRIELRKN